ncbi:unnamed protein product [Rangifer tarandus platyrhynchus]|uniref:Uncharacterized protein n=2 Tax=Rangifer tarandus platyrhynchus TaxID=3082113 RepID=A0ABN8Z9X5_RANTA|nr:unnamed protein product [Rangifer tarandus platyrhynchus]
MCYLAWISYQSSEGAYAAEVSLFVGSGTGLRPAGSCFWVRREVEILYIVKEQAGVTYKGRESGKEHIYNIYVKKVKVLVTQTCPTLCNPMDCSPPGSSVHGILQARILEWVAGPFSR